MAFSISKRLRAMIARKTSLKKTAINAKTIKRKVGWDIGWRYE